LRAAVTAVEVAAITTEVAATVLAVGLLEEGMVVVGVADLVMVVPAVVVGYYRFVKKSVN